jgi:hypothetical protein
LTLRLLRTLNLTLFRILILLRYGAGDLSNLGIYATAAPATSATTTTAATTAAFTTSATL